MEKDKILFLATYLPSCAVYLKMLPASKLVKHKENVWKWSTFESWLKSGFPSCSPHCVAIKLPWWDLVAYIHAYINLIIIIFFFCFFFVVFNNPISSSICKLPIRSEIYNCTFKNTNIVSIIIFNLESYTTNSISTISK